MSEWFYSPAPGRQEGPLDDERLAQLHLDGTLTPDTLVWREGMPAWQPWREVMHTAAMGVPALASAMAVPSAGPVDQGWSLDPGPTQDTATGVGDPPASPYAAPKARIAQADHAVRGGHVVYSGLWKRFAASSLDSMVTTIASYAIGLPILFGAGLGTAAFDPGSAAASAPDAMMFLALGAYYVVMLGVPALYFAWMHSSSHKASLGKLAVGAKVVRGDGSRIGFGRALGRYAAYLGFALVTCGLGVLISALMAAFTERKQALHDMICDTVVVDKWAYTDHPEWQREGLDTVTIVILCLYGLLFVGMLALVVFAGVAGGLGNL